MFPGSLSLKLPDSGGNRVCEIQDRFFQPGMQLLDLMSNWVSLIPESITDFGVIGPGVNTDELADNPRLTRQLIQDITCSLLRPEDDTCARQRAFSNPVYAVWARESG